MADRKQNQDANREINEKQPVSDKTSSTSGKMGNNRTTSTPKDDESSAV